MSLFKKKKPQNYKNEPQNYKEAQIIFFFTWWKLFSYVAR